MFRQLYRFGDSIMHVQEFVPVTKQEIKTMEPILKERSWGYKLIDVCPLCQQPITEGQVPYMIVNNHVDFPNCCVHKDCFEGRTPTMVHDELMTSYQSMKIPHENFLRIWG